jgi:hypothetical protein
MAVLLIIADRWKTTPAVSVEVQSLHEHVLETVLYGIELPPYLSRYSQFTATGWQTMSLSGAVSPFVK